MADREAQSTPHEVRLKRDRRIRNQRRALRENWEIVEMRRKWLGSETARKWCIHLLAENKRLREELKAALIPSISPDQEGM
jgi:hypothetical protein